MPPANVDDGVAIELGGEEGYHSLPAVIDLSTIDASRVDFTTVTSDGQIYCERNDDGVSRIGKIYYMRTDGERDSLIIRQAPASRASGNSLRQFYRHRGLGYSYNAVNGNYCNMRDFRCQILNRAVLDRISESTGENLVNINHINNVVTDGHVYSSVVEYVAEVNFNADTSGQILLFSGEASASCAVFEDGVKEQYILHNRTSSINAEYSLNYRDINIYAETEPKLLTSSFRHALTKLKDAHTIDEFIYNFGTHVVIFSRLGASMTLDVQVDAIKFESQQFEQALSQAAIATLFKNSNSTESYQKNYETLKDSKCLFSVSGGDTSIFDKLVGFNSFNNGSIADNLDSRWLQSVKFDDDDIENSNVELIDMKVIPIWEFIPDEHLARQVEARVTGNLKLTLDKIGNRNFINSSFKINPTSVTCRIGNQKRTFDNPETVDIVAANRHVATLCHEMVPEISRNSKVWVAYPIYEGKVKLTSGLCIYDGKAYKVNWSYDKFTVSQIDTGDAPVSDMVYMNCGVLSPVAAKGLEYQKSHMILGCERPGGIGIDGSLQGELRTVHKYFGHFYLDNKAKFDNLPGWEYSGSLPSESRLYPGFFSGPDYRNRMVRSNEYIYQINLTEIGYE